MSTFTGSVNYKTALHHLFESEIAILAGTLTTAQLLIESMLIAEGKEPADNTFLADMQTLINECHQAIAENPLRQPSKPAPGSE